MKIRRVIAHLPLPGLKSQSWPFLATSFLGTVANQLGYLLTAKIAVSLIPPSEYGTYSLVAGAVALTSNLVFNQILTQRARNYFDAQSSGRFIRETFLVVLRYSLLTGAGIGIWLGVFRHRGWHDALTWSAVSLVVTQPVFQTSTLFADVNQKYKLSAVLHAVSRIAQVGFLIALIHFVGANAMAITLAQTLGILVAMALLLFPGISLFSAREAALGTVPAKLMKQTHWLLIFNLAAWVLATSDRFIIGHFRSLAEVGEYAINYGLWSIPFLTINAWLDTFFRPKFYFAASDKNWTALRRLTLMRALAGFGLCCCMVVILFVVGPWLAVRLFAGPYWLHVRTMLLYITIAHSFYVMGSCAHSVLLSLKRTHPLAWATSVAAVVQVVLNILLVPRWSIIAAAFGTLISYALWFVIMVFVAYWYLWHKPDTTPYFENVADTAGLAS